MIEQKIPRVGMGILITNKNNEILLSLRKSQHGLDSWGPPGGHLEFMESFEDCAIREVFEETGLKISDPQFLNVTNDFFESKHYVSIFMKADYPLDQEIENKEPHNHEKWQWFKIDQLPDNLFLPLKQLASTLNLKGVLANE